MNSGNYYGVYATTTSTAARTSSENKTSRFCNHFLIIKSHHACKICSNYWELNWNQSFRDKKTKLNICRHMFALSKHLQNGSFHVAGRNVKNENCTCKACKTIVFHYQICKFVTFLLPSSSCLLKLPTDGTLSREHRLY